MKKELFFVKYFHACASEFTTVDFDLKLNYTEKHQIGYLMIYSDSVFLLYNSEKILFYTRDIHKNNKRERREEVDFIEYRQKLSVILS